MYEWEWMKKNRDEAKYEWRRIWMKKNMDEEKYGWERATHMQAHVSEEKWNMNRQRKPTTNRKRDTENISLS